MQGKETNLSKPEKIDLDIHLRVSWRYPIKENVETKYFSCFGLPKLYDQDSFFHLLSLRTKGFIIAPFDLNEGIYFLHYDEAKTYNGLGEIVIETSHLKDYAFENHPSEKRIKASMEKFVNHFKSLNKENPIFKKVVFGANFFKESSIPPDKYFKYLMQKFPNCFVAIYQFKDQMWMTATPEVLLESDGEKFYTHSLAGTKLGTESFNEKEETEQNIVTLSILDSYKKLGYHPESNTPQTIQYGNLKHIRNEISVLKLDSRQDEEGDGQATFLIKELHPTPAVGGYPKREAIDFILKNEIQERSFYTGFLGEYYFKNNPHLFVNLRTIQVFKNGYKYYVGAGITPQSDLEKEWEEIQNKMSQLLYE